MLVQCPADVTLATPSYTQTVCASVRREAARFRCSPIDFSDMQQRPVASRGRKMIVDFQHHFTPRELIKQDPGDRLIVHFDENGAPSYTIHSLLYDLDEHIRMMDTAGIDAAFLTSAAGMSADLERSRICNDRGKQAERDYPGRFIGAAHANPLGGPEA